MAVEYVYALHDFAPQNDDEIQFEAGERIEVIERDDLYGDGWWTVSICKIHVSYRHWLIPLNNRDAIWLGESEYFPRTTRLQLGPWSATPARRPRLARLEPRFSP